MISPPPFSVFQGLSHTFRYAERQNELPVRLRLHFIFAHDRRRIVATTFMSASVLRLVCQAVLESTMTNRTSTKQLRK